MSIEKICRGLVIVCIILSSLGTGFNVGAYTTSVYVTLLSFPLVFYGIISDKEYIGISSYNVILYGIYIIIFLFISIFNGDGIENNINYVCNYCGCILLFYSIGYFIKTNRQINIILNILFVLLLLNSVIVILQFYNSPIAWILRYVLNTAARDVESMGSILAKDEQVIGTNFCPGLFASQVYTGYFTAVLGICAVYKLCYSKKNLDRAWLLIVVFSTVIALYMIQQRMAVVVFIGFTLCIIFSKNRIVAILSFLIGTCILGYFLMNTGNDIMGRLANFQDQGREHIYAIAVDYICDHFIFGGRTEYIRAAGMSAHNIIFNAIIFGGIFGGLIILTIFGTMCYVCIRSITKSLMAIHHRPRLSVCFSYSLLSFNLISLTHNASLLTGEPLIFSMYGMLLLSMKNKY